MNFFFLLINIWVILIHINEKINKKYFILSYHQSGYRIFLRPLIKLLM